MQIEPSSQPKRVISKSVAAGVRIRAEGSEAGEACDEQPYSKCYRSRVGLGRPSPRRIYLHTSTRRPVWGEDVPDARGEGSRRTSGRDAHALRWFAPTERATANGS